MFENIRCVSLLELSLLLFLPLSLQCNVTTHLVFASNSVIHIDRPCVLQLRQTASKSNDSIHLVFTDASQSSLYRSFFNSRNASHIIVCTSTLCHGGCHACVANTTVTPRANMAAALAVLRHLHVSSLVVLYDETASSSTWRLSDFVSNTSLAPHVSLRVDLSRNDTVEQLRRTLRSVMSDRTWRYRHFVVLCSETTTRALLREASSVAPNSGLLSRQFFWIVLSPISDAARLLQHLPPLANVLIMRNHQPACSHSLSNISSAVNLARRAAAACASCDASCYDNIHHVFKDCSAQAGEVEIVALITKESEDVRVNEWKRVATHSVIDESLRNTSVLFPNQFTDFGGKTLIIGAKEYPSLVISLNRTFVQNNVTCHLLKGPVVDVVDVMSRKLNFKTCFVYPPDGYFGNFNATTKKATGLIGMAYRNEVAFVITGLTVSHSRALAVDFSFPFKNEGQGIMIRRERPQKSMFHFLLPFEWPVWLSLGCAVVLMGVVTWCLSRLSPCSGVNLQLSTARDESRLQDNIRNSVSLILEQGQENTPHAISSRLATVCLWIFSLVIVNSYTANLFTFLALENTELPIKNLEDLSNQDDIRLLLHYGSFLENVFEATTDPIMKKLYKNARTEYVNYSTEILEIVRNSAGGKYALISDYTFLAAEASEYCDHLALLPEPFMTDSTMALAWPKNAFYADEMNVMMQAIAEGGFFSKRLDVWLKKIGPSCAKSEGTTARYSANNMPLVFGAVALFAAFIAASALVLVMESLVGKFQRNTFRVN